MINLESKNIDEALKIINFHREKVIMMKNYILVNLNLNDCSSQIFEYLKQLELDLEKLGKIISISNYTTFNKCNSLSNYETDITNLSNFQNYKSLNSLQYSKNNSTCDNLISLYNNKNFGKIIYGKNSKMKNNSFYSLTYNNFNKENNSLMYNQSQSGSVMNSKRFPKEQKYNLNFKQLLSEIPDKRENIKDRIRNILSVISNDEAQLNCIKERFGNNIIFQLLNGDINTEYVNIIEKIISNNYRSNKSLIFSSKRYQIQNGAKSTTPTAKRHIKKYKH